MALSIIVTDAGRAALVNAANNGTNPVVITQAGITATAVVPSPGATAVPGEIKRISTISGDVVADDMIHLVVRDETADSYALRSFGLYLGDGTLFAIYGQAEPVMEKSSQAMMLLAIDIAFADIDAAAISFGDANFINPPATEEAQGVVELATPAETETGVDATRAVHPKGLKDAVTSWLNARFGEGNPSAFMKGLLATASAAAMRVALGIKSGALKDEGAGGGLDADLLDGQHGAYYADIPARLGFTPWGPTNDGAGSGLDAGLLAGQLPSYYTNITARLGYTPLNSTAYTAADVRTKLLTVDGAGSGIDADLLDGQQGSWYSDVPARLGYTPANKAGETFTGAIHLLRAGSQEIRFSAGGSLGWRMISAVGAGAGSLYLQYSNDSFSSSFVTGLELTSTGYAASPNQGVLWGASNDGSGSGMDADLLDGYHADAFLRLNGNTRLQQDRGYLLYANGIKETWGEIVLNANSSGYWDYPVAFSNWVHPQISVTVVNGEDNASQVTGITSVGLTGIWLYTASNSAVRIYVRILGV
ncbi:MULTISPECIES: hypothetical protein [unclassified Sphingobium]|uniref:hypothetical protein n=1 Tax=unclassified Sphingobium TaxID=2611147 RepID=UPI0022242384|nr:MULTISPECIES: hypothetical protein [unclassified Sphingobium]MCW2410873.1 hypothetical protein [Sphingobium sp. B8D3D]MCW2416837.1 hypothetical protein [Sphingobium sp. B8D3A]